MSNDRITSAPPSATPPLKKAAAPRAASAPAPAASHAPAPAPTAGDAPHLTSGKGLPAQIALGSLFGKAAPPPALSPSQQQMFDHLRGLVSSDGRQALDSLRASGLLLQQDMSKAPKTLLENLNTLATAPLPKGLNNKDLLESAITTAHESARIPQGQDRGAGESTTSGPAAHDAKNASEFVRLLGGVASMGGKVKAASDA